MLSDLNVAIRTFGLGKAYHIFARPEDRLKQILFGRRKRYYREFWALRGVDLEVRKGETFGIVGRNGSGKSTLLQLICGTHKPTEGHLQVHGRVAALLELGTGFNPEFTGRENVYLNGQILGMPRAEVENRFDKIAAFADIDQYIDQPVKTYSSGMYARLAFAVAVHVDPEILVVDEALSVGDEAFQRRCFSRIRAIRDGGATVLFVSHGASVVVELCDRVALIDHGQCLLIGEPKQVVAKYQRLLYAPPDKAEAIRAEITGAAAAPGPPAAQPAPAPAASDTGWFDPHLLPKSTIAYEPRGARIQEPHILDRLGRPVNTLIDGETYVYTYKVAFTQTAFQVRCAMLIKTVTGAELGGMVHAPIDAPIELIDAGSEWEVSIPFMCRLAPAVYFLNAGVVGSLDGTDTYLHRIVDAVIFRVAPRAGSRVTGYVDFQADRAPTVTRTDTAMPVVASQRPRDP